MRRRLSWSGPRAMRMLLSPSTTCCSARPAAGGRLAGHGALLLAAEAATAAAGAHGRRGLVARAQRAGLKARIWTQECEGARTPALREPEVAELLTSREAEVAALASQELPSKGIAERLGVSARTVENHLAQVYAKLGVHSRAELAEALGPRGDKTPE